MSERADDRDLKLYTIEWHGTITRDIGWQEVRAFSMEEAREKFLREHGQYRRVVGIMKVEEGE